MAPSGFRWSTTGLLGPGGVAGGDDGAEGADSQAADDLPLLARADDDLDAVAGDRGSDAGEPLTDVGSCSVGDGRTEEGRRWYAIVVGAGRGSSNDTPVGRRWGPLNPVSEGAVVLNSGGGRPGGGGSGRDLGRGQRNDWLRTVTTPEGRRT